MTHRTTPKTIRAALNLAAHLHLKSAAAIRARIDAMPPPPPPSSVLVDERKREREALDRARTVEILHAQRLDAWGDVADAAALLTTTVRIAEKLDDAAGAPRSDESVDAAAEILAALLSSGLFSDAERVDAVGGDLALKLGDDDARAFAASVLRSYLDAIAPRI